MDAIWASFFISYKINLFKDKISYKQFQILFKYLPKEAPICEIIKIRNMDVSKIKDVEFLKYRNSILLKENKEDSLLQALKVFGKERKNG